MLDTEDDYKKLAAELNQFDPIFSDFAIRHGFAIDEPHKGPRTWLGRIPRRYFHRKYEGLSLFIDLSIEMYRFGDVTGSSPSNPYSMGAGATVEIGDRKYKSAFMCFENVPLNEFGKILSNELENAWDSMKSWTVEYLVEHGNEI